MTRISFKGGIEQAILGLGTALIFGGSLFISTALYAQETKQQEIKQLDSNEVIKEYGKIIQQFEEFHERICIALRICLFFC